MGRDGNSLFRTTGLGVAVGLVVGWDAPPVDQAVLVMFTFRAGDSGLDGGGVACIGAGATAAA